MYCACSNGTMPFSGVFAEGVLKVSPGRGIIYILVPYGEGGSLHKLLNREGRSNRGYFSSCSAVRWEISCIKEQLHSKFE